MHHINFLEKMVIEKIIAMLAWSKSQLLKLSKAVIKMVQF